MERGFDTADRAAQGLTRTTSILSAGIKGVGIALASVGLKEFTTEAIAASRQATGLGTAFTVITGSVAGAREELQFIRREADRIGIDFVTSARSFQGLAAAARDTKLEGQGARDVFIAVAEASRTMNLSTEQTEGALTALQQIMSKGTVQAEELRGQLGERIPGAFQIAARAIDVTTAELGKMLEQGQVISEDFLPKFARQLRDELGGEAVEAASAFEKAAARLGNATRSFLARMGDIVTRSPFVIAALEGIANALKGIEDATRDVNEIPLDEQVTRAERRLQIIEQRAQQLEQRGGDIRLLRAVQQEQVEAERTLNALLEERSNLQRVIADFEGAGARRATALIASQADALETLAKFRKEFADEATVSAEDQAKAEAAILTRQLADEKRARERAAKDRLDIEKRTLDEEARIAREGFESVSKQLEEAEKERARISKREAEATQREIERAQQERARAFENFLGRAENRIADVFQRALQGNLNVLELLRDSAFAILAQIAARFATTRLVMPAVAPFFGGGGGLVGASGGALAGGGGLSGILGTTIIPAGGAAGTGFASGNAAGFGGAAVGGGLTIGTALGGAAAGLGVGLVSNQLLGELGMSGPARTGGAGALGGAATGAIIGSVFPGIGTLLGAGIGALAGGGIGAALGFGGGDRQRPEFRINAIDVAMDALAEGVAVEVERRKRDISIETADAITMTIEDSVTTLMEGVQRDVAALPPDLQDRFQAPLDALVEQFENELAGVEFDGEGLKQEFERFVNQELPATFQTIFGEITDEIRAAGQLATAIDEQIKALTEAAMTPAQRFETGLDRLTTLQGQLIGAGPQATLERAGEISQLVGSLFNLAGQADVLGGDPIALARVRDELLGALRGLRSTGVGNLLGDPLGRPQRFAPDVQAIAPPNTITQGGTITINVNGGPGNNPREVADNIVNEIERRARFGQTSIVVR